MKATPLFVVMTALLILLAASSSALPDWVTGMASNNPDDLSVLLYHGDDPIGTANPDSRGREQAVMPGDEITIIVNARKGGEPTAGTARVLIRQGSQDMTTIYVDVIGGSGKRTFIIPSNWDGNYHVEASFDGLQDAQNEFKVQGYRCRPEPEICDGKDNDCDGEIDDLEARLCGENDIGACKRGEQQCVHGSWTACTGLIEPEPETCDSIDNNCDGLVDEGLQKACGSSVGQCKQGIMICSAGGWGTCEGDAIGPSEEVCDGVDNDCDGQVDEKLTCECTDGDTKQCGSSVGACVAGIQRCERGAWGQCEGGVSAQNEICDGKDNDCDGQIDEDITQECGASNVGQCRLGVQRCDAGAWSQCEGANNPSDEVCDGLDNDCDGQVDESVIRACGAGGCLRGTQSCAEGRWGSCSDISGPQPETCDGTDNDCNGEIDDLPPRTCGNDVGTCTRSTQQCVDSAWEKCDATLPVPEICNGVDDDCNGAVDDGIACACEKGSHEACGSDIGECKAGKRTCKAERWGQCTGSVDPQPEICDGLDNDCDGETDEDIIIACGTSLRAPCKMGVMYCVDGELGPCQGAVDPIGESCDGIDNNCDGQVDENGVCECHNGDTRVCEGVGMCSGGVQRCDGGRWGACSGAAVPQPEICNNVDDNCDGSVDEDIWQSCGSAIGQCTQGIEQCVAGQWSMCVNTTMPARESCDGLDNDCDGLIDNGMVCACQDGQTRACGKKEGICTFGTQSCVSGQWNACEGGVEQQPEICDGLDNDCNGIVDDLMPRACGESDIGVCHYGQQRCVESEWQECEGATLPTPETCDGLDNDCNGQTDEGCVNPPLPPVNPLLPPRQVSRLPVPTKPSNFIVIEPSAKPGIAGNLQAQLHVDIIAAPAQVSAVDRQFGVQARVTNVGRSILPNVVADGSASVGWTGERVPVGTLDPNESRVITLAYSNILCPDTDKTEKSLPSDATLTIRAHSGDIADEDAITRDVQTPPLGILAKPVGDNLRTCILISNKGKPSRDKLEIELEVYDQQKDAIIDFFSPVKIKEDQTVMKIVDYPLNSLPTPKIYRIRANMYEEGNLFSNGYHVAEARSVVDLSKTPIKHNTGFWDILLQWLGVV